MRRPGRCFSSSPPDSQLRSSAPALLLLASPIERLSFCPQSPWELLCSVLDSCGPFPGIRLALIILGLAAGLHIPSALATITAMVRRQDWGKAMGVHSSAPTLGLVLGPLLVAALMGSVSWRTLIILLGAFSLFVGMAFLVFAKCGDFPGDAPKPAASEADYSTALLLGHHPSVRHGPRRKRRHLYRAASLSHHGTRHGQDFCKHGPRICSDLGFSCSPCRRMVCGQGRPKAGHGHPSCGRRGGQHIPWCLKR